LVLHFHVPQFPPMQTGAANSCLAFSVAPSQSIDACQKAENKHLKKVWFPAKLTEQEAEIDVLLDEIANQHPYDVDDNDAGRKRRRDQTYN